MEVTLIDSMGSDLSVVNAARVSFHKESEWSANVTHEHQFQLQEKDAKLINYLAKHGHWTPFGHAFLSFRIKAPIFVARQLVKHQVGLCWNEVSRRYVDEPLEHTPLNWRFKPTDGAKQGSSGVVDEATAAKADYLFWGLVEHSEKVYEELLSLGIAPELARAATLLDSMTEWIWSGSLAAFARVCKLRLDPHAQAETREIAEKIASHTVDGFPVSFKAMLGDPTNHEITYKNG